MAVAPTRAVATQSRAVAKIAPSAEEITAILQGMGAIETPTSEINRIKIDGSTFYIGDEPFVSNPKTGAPAFVARIVDSPRQLQSLFIDETAAGLLGRPLAAGKFCKSWFDNPAQKREYAEDGTSCRACPVNPFSKNSPLENGKKCQWKGELELQIVDPSTGRLRDDRIWILTLPTTGMIEWQGTSKDAVSGSVSELNFIRKLALLGIQRNPEDSTAGVRDAINALGLGLVVAEFRLIRQTSSDGGRSWSVPSATPIDILEVTETTTQALPAGEPLDDLTSDDLPF